MRIPLPGIRHLKEVEEILTRASIGGPLGDPALWAGIPAALRQAAGLALVYVRFRSDQAESEADIAALTGKGWRRVPVASGSNRTMTLDLPKTMDELKAGLARNWRRAMNRPIC